MTTEIATPPSNGLDDTIDRNALNSIAVSPSGALVLDSFSKMMEFAKVLAALDVAVPKHVRNNRRIALAIVIQAVEWELPPLAVAKKSYVVPGRDGDTLAFESQMIHALIERRAPLTGRLSVRYEGDGDKRVCIVSGTFKDDAEPREWRSPPLGVRRPKSGGSPLWTAKPDVQLFYDTSRDWARVYCPDILSGVYSKDEIEEFGGNGSFQRVVNPLADAPAPLPAPQSVQAPLDVPAAPKPPPAPEPPPSPPQPPAKAADKAPPPKPRTNGRRKKPAPAFEVGSMVALNNPNPPMTVVVNKKAVGSIQQGESGQVIEPEDGDGRVLTMWRSLPDMPVRVPREWLLPAHRQAEAEALPDESDTSMPETYSEPEPQPFDPETGEVPDDATPSAAPASPPPEEKFADPVRRTADEYTAYAHRWFERARSESWPAEKVLKRWETERATRNSLGTPFTHPDWIAISTEFQNLKKEAT